MNLWRNSIKAYLYLTPLFLGLALFGFYPPLKAFYGSLFKWNPQNDTEFVGIDNFITLFHDQVFLHSFIVMLKLLVPSVAIGVIIPLIVAEMIFFVRSKVAMYWYRLLILMPMVIPGVVFILVWKFIYSPEVGLFNSIFRMLGISGLQPNWLGDPSWVIFSLIFLGFPWISGPNVLIYLAGLMNISPSIIEAAELEGATGLKRVWYIDIPQLKGQVKFFIVFGIIAGLQDYGKQLILTDGGPGYSTMVPGYYLYKSAFRDGNFGLANANGVILFLVILVFTIVLMRLMKSKETVD